MVLLLHHQERMAGDSTKLGRLNCLEMRLTGITHCTLQAIVAKTHKSRCHAGQVTPGGWPKGSNIIKHNPVNLLRMIPLGACHSIHGKPQASDHITLVIAVS